MKRLFTCTIFAAIATMAFASPVKPSVTHIEKGQPAMALRVDETMKTPGGAMYAPQRATTVEGNVTITTDANGIITDVTGVEPVYFERSESGVAYYASGNSSYTAAQTGSVTVIIDGDNVYMKNPITRYANGAWVKGVKADNTVTFASYQPLAYNTSYNTTLSLRWGQITASGSIQAISTTDPFVFNVEGNVWTLQGTTAWDGTADAPFMGVFWDDDDFATGYGDAQTVLTLDSDYVAPPTSPAVLPDGATVEDWYMNATSISSDSDNNVVESPIKNAEVGVAVVGSEIYIKGISLDFPTIYVKGTIDGNNIVFDKLQYLGVYGSYDIYFTSYVTVGSSSVPSAPAATYDAAAKTVTFTTPVIINADPSRLYYLAWYEGVVLSAEAVEYPEEVITDLTTVLPYTNTFDTAAERDEAVVYDANGDGKKFTFTEDSNSGSMAARYAYSTSNNADDYLVMPGMLLEAGKTYTVAIDARAQSATFAERLEVKAGNEAKVSKFNLEVIAPTVVNYNAYQTLSNTEFSVPETGTYYFAIHAISDADKYYLWVDNFTVAVNADPNSGINSALNGVARVNKVGDNIIISGVNGQAVTVVDAFGRVIANRKGADACTITLPAKGLYVVKVGNTAYKLMN